MTDEGLERLADALLYVARGVQIPEGITPHAWVVETLRSVASGAGTEALKRAERAVCDCKAGKVTGNHVVGCPAASVRGLVGEVGGDGEK